MDYKYIDEDMEMSFPQLVLAIKCSCLIEDLKFKNPEEWYPIVHQTGGNCCHQIKIIARFLEPTSLSEKIMSDIEKTNMTLNVEFIGVSLNDLVEYRDFLFSYNCGLDCNESYLDYREGIYPIDFTDKTIKKLTITELPEDLDDQIIWKNQFQKFLGCLGRWNIFILGENSD